MSNFKFDINIEERKHIDFLFDKVGELFNGVPLKQALVTQLGFLTFFIESSTSKEFINDLMDSEIATDEELLKLEDYLYSICIGYLTEQKSNKRVKFND